MKFVGILGSARKGGNPVERGVAHYPPLTAVAPAGPKYQWV
jgi:hypothetical protein